MNYADEALELFTLWIYGNRKPVVDQLKDYDGLTQSAVCTQLVLILIDYDRMNKENELPAFIKLLEDMT